ncbi:MAG: hypothetical protein ACJAYZ_001202 [Bacteroidia bacterium]|jgi:hypothetical protein
MLTSAIGNNVLRLRIFITAQTQPKKDEKYDTK